MAIHFGSSAGYPRWLGKEMIALSPLPHNPASSGQAAAVSQAGRLALSRLAKQPEGLALDRGSQPGRYVFM